MEGITRIIGAISRCGRRYRTEQFVPLGLKGCHGGYLLEICQQPGISQEQLTDKIQVNKSNIARQVAALEEDGFITRSACGKDKRVLRLYPTEKALAVLPRVQQTLQSWEQTLTADFTPEERQTLYTLLKRMQETALQQMED